MPADVEVDATALLRLINHMQVRVQPLANAEMLHEAESVVTHAQAAMPHRSNELSNSMTAAAQSYGAVLTWGAPYAAWIEYGGSRGRARVEAGRYLGPALEGAEQRIVASAVRQLEQEARLW